MTCLETEATIPQNQQILFPGDKTVEQLWLEKAKANSLHTDPPLTGYDDFNELVVRIGSKDQRDGHSLSIDKVFVMNEYADNSKDVDVGIIITKSPMVFFPKASKNYPERYVVPVCLPKRYFI